MRTNNGSGEAGGKRRRSAVGVTLGIAALAIGATLAVPPPASADASADVWVDEENDFISYWSGSEDGDITLSYTPLREGPDGKQRFTLTIDGAAQVWIDPESPRCRYPEPDDGTRAECTLFDVTDLPTVFVELDGGDDRLTVREGIGSLEVRGGKGNDTLVSHGFGTLLGEENRDTIVDAGRGYGGDGPDTLHAQGSDARAYGEGGSDVLVGGSGDEYLFGGPGDDTAYGRYGNDTIYGGRGNDQLHGGAGNDRLYSEAGDDTAHGDSGDDLLRGGPGRDELFGGSGTDRVVQD